MGGQHDGTPSHPRCIGSRDDSGLTVFRYLFYYLVPSFEFYGTHRSSVVSIFGTDRKTKVGGFAGFRDSPGLC